MSYKVKPFHMSVRDNYLDEFKDVAFLGSDVTGEIRDLHQTDNLMSSRIDNIVAQSGDDITEIVDARNGADGTTYTALKNRLDGEYNRLKGDLEDQVGEKYTLLSGSYVSGTWANKYFSAFFKVTPGSTFSISAPNNNKSTIYYGLRSATIPPAEGDTADFSTVAGWTTTRRTEAGQTESGVLPDDVNYLWFYFGPSDDSEQVLYRFPSSVIIDGIELLSTAFDNISELRVKTIRSEMIADNLKDRYSIEQLYSPYGIEPFQLSLFKKTENLFSDFCYYYEGGYYRQRLGNGPYCPRITVTPNWKGWLIKVKPNTTYAVGPVDYQIVFVKYNGDLDTIITSFSATEPNIITSGPNSFWMCLTQRIARDMSDWMMVEGDTYPSEYISGYPQWVNIPRTGVSKKIAFFGDSITAGSGWTGNPEAQGFHQYIHDMYGFTCLNYAYGGSGYVRDYQKRSDTPGEETDGSGLSGVHGQGKPGRGYGNTHYHFWPNNVGSMMSRMSDSTSLDDLEKITDPTTLDGIVIFAGTNDWSNSIPLTTFEDGVESVFNYYHNNFGSVPLLVMTPIHRLNDTTDRVANLIEYVDIIIRKCREHGIPYIDTFSMSGLQPNNAANREVFFARDDGGNDGIHPNHLAHQKLARVIGETLNQMVLWNETFVR